MAKNQSNSYVLFCQIVDTTTAIILCHAVYTAFDDYKSKVTHTDYDYHFLKKGEE